MKTPAIIINWALRATLLPLLFALGCGGSSKPTPIAPLQQKIVFSSNRALDGSNAVNTNSAQNIWVVNPDSTGATPLTKLTDSYTASAVWSPDGKKIAFTSSRALNGSDAANTNGTYNIWVMNADGTGAMPLTQLTALNANSGLPVWSPDGTKIAFDSARALDGSDALNTNNTYNVWVMNADGTGAMFLTKLTASQANNWSPVWSPDGSKIAFESSRALDSSDADNAAGNIWIMKADGTGATPLTKLTANLANSYSPVWSPDGTKIAFYSYRALDGSDAANANHTEDIWIVNADGTGATALTKLTALNADSGLPVWSPDGTKIAFLSARALDGSDAANTNATYNIWVINTDGSSATPLTKLTASHAHSLSPAWSPDGKSIAYDSWRVLDGSDASANPRNIWVMNSDGTGSTPLTRLTAPGVYNGYPQWLP